MFVLVDASFDKWPKLSGMLEAYNIGFQVIDPELDIPAIKRRVPRQPRPKTLKSGLRPKRVYTPANRMGCFQCGDCPEGHSRDRQPFGAYSDLKLCDRCLDVYERSAKYWIPNDEYKSALEPIYV